MSGFSWRAARLLAPLALAALLWVPLWAAAEGPGGVGEAPAADAPVVVGAGSRGTARALYRAHVRAGLKPDWAQAHPGRAARARRLVVAGLRQAARGPAPVVAQVPVVPPARLSREEAARRVEVALLAATYALPDPGVAVDDARVRLHAALSGAAAAPPEAIMAAQGQARGVVASVGSLAARLEASVAEVDPEAPSNDGDGQDPAVAALEGEPTEEPGEADGADEQGAGLAVAALSPQDAAEVEPLPGVAVAPTITPPDPGLPDAGGLAPQKGSLHLPLIFGEIAESFGVISDGAGKRSKNTVRHTGWTIEAPNGHRVRCIADGQVAFASPYKGYGLLVIVDHGGGDYSVYAHLDKVLVREGMALVRGAPLGTVTRPPGAKRPHIYFELRRRGRPIDPQGWFASAASLQQQQQPR